MPDTLIHTETAWQLYLSKLAASGLSPVLWETVSAECLDSTAYYDNLSYYAGVGNEEVAATLIGIEEGACLAYFHLTGGKARFIRDTTIGNCFNFFICSTPPIPQGAPYRQYSDPLIFSAGVGDLGSDTAPASGLELLPHSGYPVCAAVKVGTDQWQAIAAGDASALTVEAAATACGTSSINACGAGETFDPIHIVIHPTEPTP